jgi:hypothetical protein
MSKNIWYFIHRKRLSEKKRQKYNTDPEFRRKVLDNVRLQNLIRNLQTLAKQSTVTHNKRLELAFTLLEISECLDIPYITLKVWKANGAIPESLYKKGSRIFYSFSQAMFLKDSEGYKNCKIRKDFLERVWNTTYNPELSAKIKTQLFGEGRSYG